VKLRDVVSRLKIDPRKLTDYALAPESLKGADKALMFRQHLGFTKETFQPLLNKLKPRLWMLKPSQVMKTSMDAGIK
jgi:hypothetical protein